MQEPPSLSQVLRDSYLAEAKARQGNGHPDAPSSHLQFHGSLKGKVDDSLGHSDTTFPDLSAFLSQEELDKSVNLACQAIRHGPQEDKAESKASITPLTLPNISPALDSPCEPPYVSLVNHSSAPFADLASVPLAHPAPDYKDLPATHETWTSDRKVLKASTREEDIIRNSRDSNEGFNDFTGSVRNASYGPETQSKKEFLNKAADFIEELSSLFKANSSKRVRPRACKTHRNKNQSKSQSEDTVFPLSNENRERAAMPTAVKTERASPTTSYPPEVQVDPESGHGECQDCRIIEKFKYKTLSQEVEADSSAATETIHLEPMCEPPQFIQKLKSREVPEGSKVQLDCTVKGLPMPEVRWFCEGKELKSSPTIQLVTNGNLHSMIIAEAFEEDTGRYSCFASNFYGTDSTSAEIYVEGASSSDSDGEHHFTHLAQVQKKSLPLSSSQTLSAEAGCLASVTDRPSGQLSASSVNQLIPETPLPVQKTATILLVPELSKTPAASKAHLSQKKEEEEAEMASPPLSILFPGDAELSEVQDVSTPSPMPTATEVASSLPLNSATLPPILPAPTQTCQPESQTSNNSYIPGMNGKPELAAPVFTKSLQELLASEGQLVVLECRVKGVPSPKVEWYRGGKLIEDSPNLRILQKKPRSPAESEEICTLVIAEVFPEDSGTFTCTASNQYGTITSTAALRVTASSSNSHRVRSFSSVSVEPGQIQNLSPAATTANRQPDVSTAHTTKPHSRNIVLDPFNTSTLHLEPSNDRSFCLDPNSSSMLGPAPESSSQVLLSKKTLTAPSAVWNSAEQEVYKPLVTSLNTSPNVEETPDRKNDKPSIIPLPDPPPNSCLKTGTLTNRRHSRSNSRAGLRVHFKLPEDEPSDISSQSDEDNSQISVSKEPPPVLAKPKLDPVQLQLLHNQVLMEQQQETDHPTQTHIQPQIQPPVQTQPEVQSVREGLMWSPSIQHEPPLQSFQPYPNTTTTPKQMPNSAASLTSSSAPPRGSAPTPKTTFSDIFSISPSTVSSPPPSFPQLKTSMLVTSPPPTPQLALTPRSTAPVTQINTIHASHLSLSPAALALTTTTRHCFSPPAPKLSTGSADTMTNLQHVTSPTPLLRSTHASLTNLTATSHTFNYTRPKEFIAAQTFSPVRSPSPIESPVPLLQELAAELNSSAASSPTLPPMSPPPGHFPVRVLQSPTSPPSFMTSTPPGPASFLSNMFSTPAQLPPKASSPISSSSTPSPIQNPVAFLSSVLPSLTVLPTNSMGLPRGAPLGLQKKAPKTRVQSAEDVFESREIILHNIEKKLQSSVDEALNVSHQQKLINKGKTGSRPLGPNIPATVINFDEEYRVSNFEQRLMSEIEFRLERTPVEESDEEVQHDDIPTGKCIAPIFEKKLKNYRAMEGVPVTFSCKIVGIPLPKVYWFKDGMQILRKNIHYRKIREGDGTCALHIESTTNDDDGNYTVMAANPQGRISCSGHLIVQTGPPRTRMALAQTRRVQVRVQEVESEQTQERFFRPHFLQAPGDMLAHEGKVCRLDCKVSGLPNPELMWLVNGRPIYPDHHHKMLVRENGIHSLVIDPLTQNDSGSYTCIASNKAGQSSFSLELKVIEREMKHPPEFVEKLQNMGIPEGTPVRLECWVVGMPPPVIFWKKDNDTISNTKDRISMTQDASGYVCLLIQPTTKEDAGWYTVSAKNEAGIVSCTCRLDIYAQWHQSVSTPITKSARAGSRYAALTGQGIDIKSAFPTSEASPILFATSPPEVYTESEEL